MGRDGLEPPIPFGDGFTARWITILRTYPKIGMIIISRLFTPRGINEFRENKSAIIFSILLYSEGLNSLYYFLPKPSFFNKAKISEKTFC